MLGAINFLFRNYFAVTLKIYLNKAGSISRAIFIWPRGFANDKGTDKILKRFVTFKPIDNKGE